MGLTLAVMMEKENSVLEILGLMVLEIVDLMLAVMMEKENSA